jgi:hypothetical protein
MSAASIAKEERLYTTVKTVMLLCALMGVSKPTIQGKICELM